MTTRDSAFIRAEFAQLFWHADPEIVFYAMHGKIHALCALNSADITDELIQIAACFASFRSLPGFETRCRDICSFGTNGDDITRLTRLWFTNIAPYREGVPMADGQNAQLIISLPRGVQRARARQNNRGDNEALLRSPFPDVIEILCANPAIRENDVLFICSRRPTRNELLEPVLASAWSKRPEIRCALAANPYINTSHALRCVFTLSHVQLKLIADMNELHPQLRVIARQIDEIVHNPKIPQR